MPIPQKIGKVPPSGDSPNNTLDIPPSNSGKWSFLQIPVDGWAACLKNILRQIGNHFRMKRTKLFELPPAFFIPKNQIRSHQLNGVFSRTIYKGVQPQHLPNVALWQIPMGKAPKNMGILWVLYSSPRFPSREPGPGVGADSFPGTW